MISLKSPHRPRPLIQKYKLAKLLDCFEVNSHSEYKITAQRGELRIAIDQDQDFFAEEHYESEEINHFNNCEEVEVESKKKIGLFANIIKNMENKKQIQEQKQEKKLQKPKGYTFYFPELNHRNKKKQNERNRPNTAQTQQCHFDNIQIIQQTKKQNKQKYNKENENQPPKAENFIDLNFSFDQISRQMKSLKDAAPMEQRRNEEDTIIHKYLNENSYAQGQTVKNDIKLSKDSKNLEKGSLERPPINQKCSVQSINFAKLSKQYKISESQLISPIPARAKHSLSKGFLKQSSELTGTKKVESRIIENCQQNDAHNIRIDFDLDINFI